MIRMKVGGMILTGCAAFLMANKIVNSMDSAISRVCETAKWRGYYKCWANGKAQGEPLAPGYSRTTRPDKADFEVVDDPTGADHSKDNDPKPAEGAKSTDAAKAVVEAVKDIAEKVVDNLTKPSSEPREASEGQTDVSESDISDLSGTDKDDGTCSGMQPEIDLENVIEGVFAGDTDGDSDPESIEEMDKTMKELKDHETVD